MGTTIWPSGITKGFPAFFAAACNKGLLRISKLKVIFKSFFGTATNLSFGL